MLLTFSLCQLSSSRGERRSRQHELGPTSEGPSLLPAHSSHLIQTTHLTGADNIETEHFAEGFAALLSLSLI